VAGLAKLIERAGIEAKIGFKVHPHTRDALGRTTPRGTNVSDFQFFRFAKTGAACPPAGRLPHLLLQ
jgi:hypothetical protein